MKSTNTTKEWLSDSLATAAATAHIDGDAFSADTLTAPARLSNYHTILRKDIVVTRRADIVNKAGRKSELAYEIAKGAKELKRNVEYALLQPTVAAVGADNSAPTLAGLPSWLKTNTDRGATGTDPTLSGTTYGYPDAAPGDGTDRALTESGLLGVIASAYIAGGDPNTIMCGPLTKQKISNFMFGSSARIATPYQDAGAKKSGVSAIGAVDVYVSDYGVMDIVPNRFQREDDCFVLDTEQFAVSYLSPYTVKDTAITGDVAAQKILLVDFTLCSKNEAASGIYADVDETVAMTA